MRVIEWLWLASIIPVLGRPGFTPRRLHKRRHQRTRPMAPKVSLVLSGGIALGAYQAGAYAALHEHRDLLSAPGLIRRLGNAL